MSVREINRQKLTQRRRGGPDAPHRPLTKNFVVDLSKQNTLDSSSYKSIHLSSESNISEVSSIHTRRLSYGSRQQEKRQSIGTPFRVSQPPTTAHQGESKVDRKVIHLEDDESDYMIMDDINLTLSQIDSVPSKSGISDTRSIDQNKRLSISQSSKRKEPEDDHVMTEIPIHTTDDKDTQGHVEQVDHLTIPDTASQNMETMSIQNMETTSIHSNIDTHKEDTNLEDSSAMNMEMVRQDREEATVEGDKELVTMDTANENIQGNFDQSNQNHSIDISMDMPDMEYNDYGHQSQSIVEGGDPNETDMAIQSMVDEIRQRMIDNRDQKKRKTMVLAVLHIEVFKSIINKVMKNIKRTSTHHTTNQSIEEYFKYTTEELDRQLQLYSNFQLYSNRNSRLTKLSTEYRTILFENEKSIEKTMKKSREIMMIQQQQKQKLETYESFNRFLTSFKSSYSKEP